MPPPLAPNRSSSSTTSSNSTFAQPSSRDNIKSEVLTAEDIKRLEENRNNLLDLYLYDKSPEKAIEFEPGSSLLFWMFIHTSFKCFHIVIKLTLINLIPSSIIHILLLFITIKMLILFLFFHPFLLLHFSISNCFQFNSNEKIHIESSPLSLILDLRLYLYLYPRS